MALISMSIDVWSNDVSYDQHAIALQVAQNEIAERKKQLRCKDFELEYSIGSIDNLRHK
jgi:hypothetical protein